jgi:DNA polymerase-3 subunit gamma/tau
VGNHPSLLRLQHYNASPQQNQLYLKATMGQALYRKYRSRSLGEIVGQEHITDTLGRAIEAGRISHAYLFTGPRGTGKTSVARILAHEINSLPYADATHLDIIEIDAASNRRIDDIRDLREKVHIAPVNAKYKVYIIDEVHMLTGESFNALLKTLEEPPSHVVFILATTEVHKLPATIISRTQRYSFRPGARDKMIAHLKSIANKESIAIDDAALELVAEHGEGSFRDSLSLLDQLAHISTNDITAADVAGMLGLAPKEQVHSLVAAIEKNDATTIISTISALEQQGSNVTAIVDQLAKELLAHAAKHPSHLALVDRLLDVPRAYNPQLKLIAALTAHLFAPAKNEPKTAATMVAAPAPVTIAQVPPKPKPLPKPAPAAKVVEPAEEKASQQLPPVEPLTTMETADWARVLDATRAKNAPLYSVLKMAQPVLQDDALVLTFKFALHGKKIEDTKQKTAVVAIIQEVLGKTPVIKVATNKDAVPPVISDDPNVTKVAAIMGGGEIV